MNKQIARVVIEQFGGWWVATPAAAVEITRLGYLGQDFDLDDLPGVTALTRRPPVIAKGENRPFSTDNQRVPLWRMICDWRPDDWADAARTLDMPVDGI